MFYLVLCVNELTSAQLPAVQIWSEKLQDCVWTMLSKAPSAGLKNVTAPKKVDFVDRSIRDRGIFLEK